MDFKTELLEYLRDNYNMDIHENGRIALFDIGDKGYDILDCEKLSIDIVVGNEDDNGLRVFVALTKITNKYWSRYLSQMPLFDGYIGDVSDINPILAMTGLSDILLSKGVSQSIIDKLQERVSMSIQLVNIDKSIYGSDCISDATVDDSEDDEDEAFMNLLTNMIDSDIEMQNDMESNVHSLHDHECDCGCEYKSEYDLSREELELVVESYREIIDKIINKASERSRENGTPESTEEECIDIVESIVQYLDCIVKGGCDPWPEIDPEVSHWIDTAINEAGEDESDAMRISKALKVMFEDLLADYINDDSDGEEDEGVHKGICIEDVLVNIANDLKEKDATEGMVYKGIYLAEQSRVNKLIEASADESTEGE